jgi:hypothetical protein
MKRQKKYKLGHVYRFPKDDAMFEGQNIIFVSKGDKLLIVEEYGGFNPRDIRYRVLINEQVYYCVLPPDLEFVV